MKQNECRLNYLAPFKIMNSVKRVSSVNPAYTLTLQPQKDGKETIQEWCRQRGNAYFIQATQGHYNVT